MKTLMHKNAMDLAFHVLNKQYEDTTSVCYQGHWMSLGYVGEPYRLNVPTTNVHFSKRELADWVVLTEKQLSTKRMKPGVP